MDARWVVLALLGIVALSAVIWPIASEVRERRRARAAGKIASDTRSQSDRRTGSMQLATGGTSPRCSRLGAGGRG